MHSQFSKLKTGTSLSDKHFVEGRSRNYQSKNSFRVKEFTRNRWQELIDDPQRQTRKTDNRGNIKTGEVKQLINKVEKKNIRIESLGLPV